MAEMDEMTKGALQEAGNIGMGHLATSLSKIVKREVKIDIPVVEIVSLNEILKESEGDSRNKIVAGIHVDIKGDVNGGMLLLFPKFSALSFSDILTKKSVGTTSILEEIHITKLENMGFQLCSSYMKAINEFIGLELKLQETLIKVDMDGITDFISDEMKGLADEFIVIRNECFVPSTNSRHKFNMLFEPDASDTILTAVMQKMMG